MSSVNNSSISQLRCIVMGVSGCGKSEIGARLAARLGMPYLEGDADHPAGNIAKMKAGIPLDDTDRRGWLLTIQGRIREAAEADQGLILSCSALKRAYRDLLREADSELVFIHLAGSCTVIANRIQARPGHFMPVSLLESQFRDLEPPGQDERAISLDIETTPDALVEQVVQHLNSQQRVET
jgi:gluconokinase